MDANQRKVLGFLRTQPAEQWVPVGRIQNYFSMKNRNTVLGILEELDFRGDVEVRRHGNNIKDTRITQEGINAWSNKVLGRDVNISQELKELRQAIDTLQHVVGDGTSPPQKHVLSFDQINNALDTLLKADSIVNIIRHLVG